MFLPCNQMFHINERNWNPERYTTNEGVNQTNIWNLSGLTWLHLHPINSILYSLKDKKNIKINELSSL